MKLVISCMQILISSIYNLYKTKITCHVHNFENWKIDMVSLNEFLQCVILIPNSRFRVAHYAYTKKRIK